MPKPGSARPSDCHLYYVSTEATARPGLESLPPCCPVRADKIQEKPRAAQRDESGVNPVRINWQLKPCCRSLSSC